MRILGVDTTGSRLSVALSEDEMIIAEVYGDDSKKHLETLMPCLNELMRTAGTEVHDIDLYALSAGPGSFTGIRIGAAAVEAMAQRYGKDVVQVDTLEALCRNVRSDASVCAMIDARHDEVFARVMKGDEVLFKSRPVSVNDLLKEIGGRETVFVGDGAKVYSDRITAFSSAYSIAEDDCILQKGSSVCLAGYDMFLRGEVSSCFDIKPMYMKLSQAERYKKLGR